MEKQAKTYLNDHHLWLSVFNKPVQSTFTRIDRVTCCFVFHYLAMVLNILYYNKSLGILPDSIQIDLVLTSLTIEQVIRFLYFVFFLKIFDTSPLKLMN